MFRTFLIAMLMTTLAQAAPLKAVASFTVLADMVHEVGGDMVEVKSIVGPNGDTHAYEATPADSKSLSSAQIIFVNGLGLDSWIEKLAISSGFKGQIIITTKGINPRHRDEEGKQVPDPHAWQDLSNGLIYVSNIAAALCDVDAAHCETFRANATSYNAKLNALDVETRAKFASVPLGRRQVVTTHDAFGYFAAAYDVRFLAPVGFASESEPSAAALSKLILQIKHDNIKALFFENMSDPRVIEAIAAETGIRPGAALLADALPEPGERGDSYITMFKYNADTLLNAIVGK